MKQSLGLSFKLAARKLKAAIGEPPQKARYFRFAPGISKLLFYDLTNFFTYIDTTNDRSELAKRGRNKQKRHDLRQFGLAQVVTQDFLLPVFSEVY